MEPTKKTRLESPAWQQPAPGNEQNDAIKGPTNTTIKTGGNFRSAEDDLELDEQPSREESSKEEKDDPSEDPDEQSF